MFCCAIELNIHFDELIQFDKSWGIMDTFLSRIIHEDEWRQVICNICNNSNQLEPDSGLLDTAHIASWSVKSFPKDFQGSQNFPFKYTELTFQIKGEQSQIL